MAQSVSPPSLYLSKITRSSLYEEAQQAQREDTHVKELVRQRTQLAELNASCCSSTNENFVNSHKVENEALWKRGRTRRKG